MTHEDVRPDVGRLPLVLLLRKQGSKRTWYRVRSRARALLSREAEKGCETLNTGRNEGGRMSIKLKQPQRVFIVQCGFVVFGAVVAVAFVAALA